MSMPPHVRHQRLLPKKNPLYYVYGTGSLLSHFYLGTIMMICYRHATKHCIEFQKHTALLALRLALMKDELKNYYYR